MPEPITMMAGGFLLKKIAIQGGLSGGAYLLKQLAKSEGFENAMQIIAEHFGTGFLRDIFENFPELLSAAVSAVENAEWFEWLTELA